nr:MAG: hypothetical protein [Bacteriophage sp.]
MDTITVYTVKTDIVKEDKTKLQINVIGENLSDAISSASYLKYNGEELRNHIISIEKFVDKVYRYTYMDDGDLNPNYKPKEDKNNENT